MLKLHFKTAKMYTLTLLLRVFLYVEIYFIDIYRHIYFMMSLRETVR